ncbi:MAG: PucR family transcriptional regulator [Mycobacteriales bacterium]
MSTAELDSPWLIQRLACRRTELVDRMMGAFLAEVPAYREMPTAVLDDVRRIIDSNVSHWLASVDDDRRLTSTELAGFTASARQRAHQGIPLEPLLHAYRLGTRVAGEVIQEEAAGRPIGAPTALAVLSGIMRYVDQVSTAVAQAYLEERERMVTDVEWAQRELASQLLAAGPADPAVREFAERTGVALAERYWVLLVAVTDATSGQRVVAQQVRTAASAAGVVAVPRETDVLTFWPAHDGEPPAGLGPLQRALARDRGGALVALAGPAATGMQAALREAETVLRLGTGRAGVLRLQDVTLAALVAQAGERAVELAKDRLSPLVAHDRAHGGELIATVRAYLDCDASLQRTAKTLFVHRNTVTYRLARVRELTGLDPDVLADLFLLYAALLLQNA